ncbi:MFS transporter [uncultured Paracoccus sp.]|uniref:MFS transporter n=1 Tax=uncultured Paracoccus sp. TaxID=189685 RepID=UPI00262AD14D|nr:MFS transporter [uncultured Paracoccus sp.]
MTAQTADLRRAWRNILVLAAAQGILGAQMSMIFITGGLAGQMLSPNPCIATLPVSMVILGSALAARPLSGLMARRGRRFGFSVACLVAAVGAALAVLGLRQGSFWLFTAGTMLSGVYMSAQGFYRFAATDAAPADLQPRAIGLVLGGGLIAAILGPALVRATSETTLIPFAATYVIIVGLNLAGPLLFALLDSPRPVVARSRSTEGRTLGELLRTPEIAVAMICAMVSYALMNLVMTSTPLAVVGCGFSPSDAADVVSMHVIAMFLPSFFTGNLINRFGAHRIVAVGLLILAASGAVALTGVALAQFHLALILLGLGWNFGYIGATAMLTSAHTPAEGGRIQGINDAVVFGGVFVASLASGGLMNCSGGNPGAGWQAVNLAMLPFLILAGGALIWLTLRPRTSSA